MPLNANFFSRPGLTLLLASLFACSLPPEEQQTVQQASIPRHRHEHHAYHRAAVDSLPTEIPHRVVLNWSGDPATSVSVTWRTSTTIDTAAGQIAVADASPNFVVHPTQTRATTEPWQQGDHRAHFHSVTFTGLAPNTLYAYRVGSGNIWSEWFHFRTARAQPAPFSFIYFGDAQNNLLSLWSRTVRAAYADAPRADFLLHAGDLIGRANKDSDWAEWFEAGSFIHAQIPCIPSPGNHEYFRDAEENRHLSVLWHPHFTLPRNGPDGLEETVYYIDYQGARIISLNSNERREDQAPWLDNVLKTNPNRWTFITFHHPVFATAKGRDNKDLREAWKPLFDKYAVDMVLTGHDHTYGRGDNITRGINVREHETGTVYVVSVSGPKQYALTENRWMARAAANTQLYQVISVDADTLRYRAMTVTGRRYDAFDLIKQDGKPNRLVERIPGGTPERTYENTLPKPEDKSIKVY